MTLNELATRLTAEEFTYWVNAQVWYRTADGILLPVAIARRSDEGDVILEAEHHEA